MADDSAIAGSTAISPEDAAKLWAKRAGSSRAVSAADAAKLWAAKNQQQSPSIGQLAKMGGQNIAVQGAGLAPIVAGAELGGELGAGGGPFAEVTVPLGAMAGAGIGAMTSPAARYYMGKLVGSEQPEPTVKESNYEAKIAALTEEFGPIASRWSSEAVDAVYDALVGRSQLAEAGTKAAQAAEQQNVAAKEKLDTAATREAERQKSAAADAAEKTGQANLAERTKAAESAAAKQTEFQQAHEEAKQRADADFQKQAGKLQQGIVPEAREETITGTLGKTPEQTRAARFAENAPQKQAALRDIIFQKSNEAGNEFSKEYEDVIGPVADKPIQMTATAQKAQELENQAKAGNWALSPSTQRLLAESKGMSRTEGKFDPREFGYTAKQWAKKSPTEQQQIIKMAGKMTQTGGTAAALEHTTIGQARGLNSKWGAQSAGSESFDGLVAREMREAVLKDLDNAGIPRLKELNNRYRAFRNGGLGDYDFLGKVSQPKGGELHNISNDIFGNPQRGSDFVKRLNPEEKAQFRDMYADYIHTGGKISPDHAPLLGQLGFKGPLTKPESWVYADKQAANLDEIFATSPNARAKLQQQVGEVKAQREAAFNNEVLKEAQRDAKALGMTGNRILAKINAAKTPSEKVNTAIQEFNDLNPTQAAQDVVGTQQKPGMAAYQASRQAPRTARQAAQDFQPQSTEDAAVKAIREFSPTHGKWSGYLLRRAAFAGLGGGMYGALSGRISPIVIEGAASAGAVLGRDLISAAWRSSIQESPEAALQFYRAMQNAGTPAGMNTLAQKIVDGSVAQYMAQHGRDVQPEPPTPASTTPGPMVKHVEEKKAENIAGPRGAISPNRISAIKDTSKEIAAGNAPDIQADLRNGRISHGDVTKMLAPDKPGLAALFQGLTPQQAVDAFARADPRERELALPALAQHLQDSKLPPQQAKAMLAQLKAVMAPQQKEETRNEAVS